jgi:hypothetical protein
MIPRGNSRIWLTRKIDHEIMMMLDLLDRLDMTDIFVDFHSVVNNHQPKVIMVREFTDKFAVKHI